MSTKLLIGVAITIVALIVIGASFAIFNHVEDDRLNANPAVTATPPANPLGGSTSNQALPNPLGNPPQSSPQNAPANPLSSPGNPPAANPLGQ